MKRLGLLLIGLVFVLSACTATSNNTNNKRLSPTQKSWKNYQTKQRGYGVYYPGYNNAPTKKKKPAWVNRPYNQPPKAVRPMPRRR